MSQSRVQTYALGFPNRQVGCTVGESLRYLFWQYARLGLKSPNAKSRLCARWLRAWLG